MSKELIEAVKAGDVKKIEELKAGVELAFVDENDSNALHWAAVQGHAGMIKLGSRTEYKRPLWIYRD